MASVVSKTIKPSNPQNTSNSDSIVEGNVFNNYRSYTYNITLGALTSVSLKSRTQIDLNNDIENFTVLTSSGKGRRNIGIGSVFSTGTDVQSIQGLVDGFNSSSPGRADMYIDDLVVEAVMTGGTQAHGPTQASKISFTVFEPYSMNGFVEALQVASKASGWGDYIRCSFALRVRFIGYKDSETLPSPEVIPKSTRFFLVQIATVNVEVTEQGTVYKVECVPVDQMGYGREGQLQHEVVCKGKTVAEMLFDFFEKVNKMYRDDAKTKKLDASKCDVYKISAPKFVEKGKSDIKAAIITSGTAKNPNCSDIIDAIFDFNQKSEAQVSQNDKDKDKKTAPDPTGSTLSVVKVQDKVGTAVFKPDVNIHNCIASIIRDSQYTRNLMTPEKAQQKVTE